MKTKLSPLISVKQLCNKLDNENLVILDASIPPVGNMQQPQQCWPSAIIQGARRFDINNGFSDEQAEYPHTMPSEAQFIEKAQALGINKNSEIVVYDSFGIFSSARAWWMFKAMGHKNVTVLNGGLPQWIKEGLPLASYAENILVGTPAGSFQGEMAESYFCQTKEVSLILSKPSHCVLDARSTERFQGDVLEPRPGIRSGHMPGAQSLPFSLLLNDGLMRPTNELKQLFKAQDALDKHLVLTCGSGVTACVIALAATQCNIDDIAVYDGSWSEWGARKELPVVIGKDLINLV